MLFISPVREHFVLLVMKLYHEFVYLEKKDKHPSQKWEFIFSAKYHNKTAWVLALPWTSHEHFS